jgi:hypothetical protein
VEGISIIDIDLYDDSGRNYGHPSKRMIDSINELPGLDKEMIKSTVARKYGIPKDNITFS